MDDWLTVLQHSGAQGNEADQLDLRDCAPQLSFEALQAGFVAPLTDFGLLAVAGPEAAQFLQNQLTNDVLRLGSGQARLAGYCTPKGRLLATFVMWQGAADATPESGQILLQLPREILPALQKRLQMFVLRAKVTLTDLSQQQLQFGLGGEAAALTLLQWFPALLKPYAKVDNEFGTLVRMADALGAARFVWLCGIETAQAVWPALAAALRPAGPQAWRLSGIHAGVPLITTATQDQFVPQMINLEVIGGVDFQKGCYPGQEIVARSQYLGKRKRRMMRAAIALPEQKPVAGMEVFSSLDPTQPCGMLVNAECSGHFSAAPEGQRESCECLVEIKLAALEGGEVRLGSPAGALLHFLPLPYALPPDNATE